MAIKDFTTFINEGQKEQDEINRLIDLMGQRKLTDAEMKTLQDLSDGKLLDSRPPALKKHKTGNLMMDDEGDVLTDEPSDEDDEKVKSGQEFVTKKGKSKSADKIEEATNARVYRNQDSEERIFYILTSNGWEVYRSGGNNPFGLFLNKEAAFFKRLENSTAEDMWANLDWTYDIGMELDKKTLGEFNMFMELYQEDQKKNKSYLEQLHKKLKSLI